MHEVATHDNFDQCRWRRATKGSYDFICLLPYSYMHVHAIKLLQMRAADAPSLMLPGL